MAKKAERESQSDVTCVQGDTDGDMTLSETVHSDWCEPLNVANPTTTPCVTRISTLKFISTINLKLLFHLLLFVQELYSKEPGGLQYLPVTSTK